jgi:hypothetical protein
MVKEIAAAGRSRARGRGWILPGACGCSLAAAAILVAALYPTFVSQVCPGNCVGTAAPLRQSPDAWAVVWIAGILAVTALLVLTRMASRLMTAVNALAALAGLGLAVFEGVVSFPRVLDTAEDVVGTPTFVFGVGYFLFLIGGVIAVCATAAMLVVAGRSRSVAGELSSRTPGFASAAWASLCVLAAATIGLFLPFVTVSCGNGCPPDTPTSATYTGAFAASMDGRIVIGLLVATALAMAAHLVGWSKRRASITALSLMLVATVLVSIDSLNGAARVLGWPYAIPTVPAPGYYVLQAATALCAVLSVLLVVDDKQHRGVARQVGLRVRRSAGNA